MAMVFHPRALRSGMRFLIRLHNVNFNFVTKASYSRLCYPLTWPDSCWASRRESETKRLRLQTIMCNTPFDQFCFRLADQFLILPTRLYSSGVTPRTPSRSVDTLVEEIYDDKVDEKVGQVQKKNKKGKKERVTIQAVGKKIPDKTLQLIDENGQNLGPIDRAKAIKLSEEKNLKIVLIGKNAKPYPIYKLMSGQQLVEERIKLREREKNKTPPISSKEVKLSGNITSHDLDIKTKRVHEWLRKGHHVKVIIKDNSYRFGTTHEHKEHLVHTILADMEGEATLNGKARAMGKDGKDLQCTLRLMSAKEKAQRKKKKDEEIKPKESEEKLSNNLPKSD